MLTFALTALAVIRGFVFSLRLSLVPGNDAAITNQRAGFHLLKDQSRFAIFKTKQAVNGLVVWISYASSISGCTRLLKNECPHSQDIRKANTGLTGHELKLWVSDAAVMPAEPINAASHYRSSN
ncbi:MAG: hypothetical protein KGI52_11685 [Burkholderiales bacterium]|nr:hypothetical protein [Burkholderiales bacterium]